MSPVCSACMSSCTTGWVKGFGQYLQCNYRRGGSPGASSGAFGWVPGSQSDPERQYPREPSSKGMGTATACTRAGSHRAVQRDLWHMLHPPDHHRSRGQKHEETHDQHCSKNDQHYLPRDQERFHHGFLHVRSLKL